MKIIIIAAIAANRVIGNKNDIPWHIPGEQEQFKKTTWGHPIIMGRKTWESIGHPLPGRRNIVVTRNPKFTANGGETVLSLDSALDNCQGEDKVFIIGGAEIFKLALKKADTLILTILDRSVKGDTYFPEFSEKCDFKLIHSTLREKPEKYTIALYEKK